jgi:hypothetical protein
MPYPKDAPGSLYSLLRGELAATVTYREAMDVLGHAPGATDLRRIQEEHREAAHLLRVQIRVSGGQPEGSGGAWGGWTGLGEETARVFGPRVAAQALLQGEQSGVRGYEQALRQDDLPAGCKSLILDQLLPHTREHVATLERILELL